MSREKQIYHEKPIQMWQKQNKYGYQIKNTWDIVN